MIVSQDDQIRLCKKMEKCHCNSLRRLTDAVSENIRQSEYMPIEMETFKIRENRNKCLSPTLWNTFVVVAVNVFARCSIWEVLLAY